MPDYFIIFIILLALVMVNIIGWVIRDIIKLNKDNNETEHWLTAPSHPCDRGIRASCPSHQGEKHDSNT